MNSPAKPDGTRTGATGGVKSDRNLTPGGVPPSLVTGGESALACLPAGGAAQAASACEGGTPPAQGSSVKIDRGI